MNVKGLQNVLVIIKSSRAPGKHLPVHVELARLQNSSTGSCAAAVVEVLQYAIFPCRSHMGHCPGETGSLLWLSFSLQEMARNRLCRYCIVFLTKNCDVLPHSMHKVTFTSPLTFHIFVEMYVHCTFGHFNI